MIYVDLGAYTGDTIEQFLNWKNLCYKGDFEIHAFEPNPDLKFEPKGVNFHPEAAWIYDGEISLWVDKHDPAFGSTIMSTKKSFRVTDNVTVPCIDFSQWLYRFVGELVIVKMDIEGAEYQVIEKMIKDDTDRLIHTLFVEWHEGKMNPKPDKEPLIKQLKCRYFEWK